MYNLLIDTIRSKIPLILAAMLTLCVCAIARAQVDYASQVQPLFTRSCEGGFCHIGMDNSGIVAGEIDAAVVHSYMTEATLAGAGEDRLDLAGVVYLCRGDRADAEGCHHGHDERNLAADSINQQVVHNCTEPTT